MPEQLEEVTARLANERVQFVGVSKSNPDLPITFDYAPPIGDGKGFNGLELLLMSLAGCSATAIVYVLRKMGRSVTALEVNAKGVRREQPPMKFKKILLDFTVSSKDATDTDVGKAISLAEQSVCPVWQMIKDNVQVASEYKIVDPSIGG